MQSRMLPVLMVISFLLCSAGPMIEGTPLEDDWNSDTGVDEVALTPEQRNALSSARVSTGNWLHHVGGIGSDEGTMIRVGNNGDIYVGGNVCHGAGTCSAIFGSTTIYANNDFFVARLGADGTWKWITQTSGTNSNNFAKLSDLEVDSYGNVFVSGYFNGNKDFGNISRTATNNYDGMVGRIDDTGNWTWVERARTNDRSYSRGIAIDSNQNVYVTGESYVYYFGSSVRNAWFTSGSHTTSSNSAAGTLEASYCGSYYYMPWLVKYSSSGIFQWVDKLDDDSNRCNSRYMADVVTDSNDSVIVTGKFDSSISIGSLSATSAGGWDIFLAKVNSTHSWQWLTHGGGLSEDRPEKLAVDGNNRIVVVGYNYNHASYGTTIILANQGGFVVRALGNGTWEWGTRIGPNSHAIEDVAIHANDNMTVVGSSYITHLDANGSQQWYESNSQSLKTISLDTNGTSYISGLFNGNANYENYNLVSNGSDDLFIWKWDRDRDGDSVADRLDNCGDHFNANQDDYDGDGPGDVCDDDDDNDGFYDVFDNCPQGDMNWISNSSTDRDNDGCQDAGEDTDDDDDGINDTADSCHPTGLLNWTSNGTTDHDGDGCNDAVEDSDDDNDGVADIVDICSVGDLGWTSNLTSDHDTDGCMDAGEDLDDDNDGLYDGSDDCFRGDTGWISNSATDHDGDGCQDSNEDLDDDQDGAEDSEDLCPTGVLSWIRYISADYDDDGCRDSDEDYDDDNDQVNDHMDICRLGELNWTSNPQTDNDGDGCRDLTEDNDDDNDGISDVNDFCAQGESNWTSGRVTDHDSDGCYDLSEDLDDDGDGVPDIDDNCSVGMLGWVSNSGSDYDGDGCLDATEDGDDDGDGVFDHSDPCPFGEENCVNSGSNTGNVTIIHQYPEDSDDNESLPVTTTVIHYHNNSTTIVHYHNNSTINEAPEFNGTVDEPVTSDNGTEEEESEQAIAGEEETMVSSGLMEIISTIALLLIACFVLLLFLGQSRTPRNPSDEDMLFADDARFDYTPEPEMEQGFEKPVVETEPIVTEQAAVEPTTSMESIPDDVPPTDAHGVISNDGMEWVEHPMGSSNHWYRQTKEDPWQKWDN